MAKNTDGLIAVWDGQSCGTGNMIENASKPGLRVFTLWNDIKMILGILRRGKNIGCMGSR
jgi:hypothetical protein